MSCLPCQQAARARALGAALADAPPRPGFGKVLAVIGVCVGLGLAGIVVLEVQQGWRPGRRR